MLFLFLYVVLNVTLESNNVQVAVLNECIGYFHDINISLLLEHLY